jgi:type I restriction enzyme S subunit
MAVSSDHFVKYTSQTVREGSKMPRADWKVMQQYSVLLPPVGLLASLADVVEPVVDQLKALTFQNRNARAARDLLLPRLMSGEIAA